MEDEFDFVVKFKNPVKWEEKEYSEIDFSGIELLSARDLESVYREYAEDAGVKLAALPEFSPKYCCLIAAKASKMPVEFFLDLNPKVLMQVRSFVRDYFFTED